MARLTVEDCLKNTNNRFKLVLQAAKRAKQIERGGTPLVEDIENDKPTVLALREIASGVLRIDKDTEEKNETDITTTEESVESTTEVAEDTAE